MKNIPQRAKEKINEEHIYINDFLLECYREISSDANTWKPSPFVLVCSYNLNQRTTMIKDMHLDK